MKFKPLMTQNLCACLDPTTLPWLSSDDIPRPSQHKFPQPRALKALNLAMHITAKGYNIYLSGGASLGRSYLLREFITPRAKKSLAPPDLLYVNNFDDLDKPSLVRVPAGMGRKLRESVLKTLETLRKELQRCLDNEFYAKKRGEIQDKFQNVRADLLKNMDKIAGGQGFNLDMDEQGNLTLYPLFEGKRLSEDEFEKLDLKLRNSLKQKSDTLLRDMSGMVRKLNVAEQNFRSDEKGLDREVVKIVLEEVLDPLVEKQLRACQLPLGLQTVPAGAQALVGFSAGSQASQENVGLKNYFNSLRKDILDNPDNFLPRDILNAPGGATEAMQHLEQMILRYEINVFVEHGKSGAPVIFEDHPTSANLLGCVEREAEMGALITDFTLIKAGSLHKANGGFLVLHLEDILQYPTAWEGLLRALKSGVARLEEPGDGPDGAVRTKGIEPEPIPLQVKVILIGSEDLYESLLLHDERFAKLFKIKAQLTETTDRTASGIRSWLTRIAQIIDEHHLPPFSREALSKLVDYSSLLSENQKKLSLRFPIIRDVIVEAAAMASMSGTLHKPDNPANKMDNSALAASTLTSSATLDATLTSSATLDATLTSSATLDVSTDPKASQVQALHVQEALAARSYRANLVEELYMEEYDRELIKVQVTGEAVGQVNGLAVSWYGDFEFGLPHQISCTVGVGHGGIIDLEREAELGGPIHTKAMLILKSYLVAQFARTKPLVFTGSLCFEQNYAGVEGDSASGAELAALISALSHVPIKLSFAFTGAVSQSGAIMAVGGVTRKIEGFFTVCKRRGLTGEQGVIIPYDNIHHLMLAPEVLEAVTAGQFAIYPVKHITEALELLTGLPTGRSLKDQGFTKGSLYDLVDKRLFELGHLAEHAFSGKPKRKPKITGKSLSTK